MISVADVHGSLEALCDAIAGLPSHEVQVNVVYSGVGAVNDSDIELAAATSGMNRKMEV
jgi:translation initiation factor IF-2